MKNNILFRSLLILFLTLAIGLGQNLSAKEYSKSKKLRQYFERHVEFPSHQLDANKKGLVLIDFTICDSGNLVINQINYSDAELKDLIISELELLCMEGKTEFCGLSFIYKFEFVTE